MDVLYFLKERTRLIREYYEHAARPFNEIIRKIEAEEEPYIPPYSEDPEPAFLSEWIEADELLDVTGRCCISMLSASLRDRASGMPVPMARGEDVRNRVFAG